MSRDWTPREMLAAEKVLEGRKWLDVSRGMVFTHNGVETPMCPKDYCDFLEQYKYLSSVGYDAVLPLYKKYGKTYTNPGDIVVDTFMGSNTTGLACKNLNRNYIGIEKELYYFEISKQRIS